MGLAILALAQSHCNYCFQVACVCSKWGGSRLEDDGHRERRLARDWRVSSLCTEFLRCVNLSLCLLQAQSADVTSSVFASGTACGRLVPCNYVEIMSASH